MRYVVEAEALRRAGGAVLPCSRRIPHPGRTADSGQWHSFNNGGALPDARYAHSATVLASNLIIFFGGFDSRRYFNDMHILDLSELDPCWVPALEGGCH